MFLGYENQTNNGLGLLAKEYEKNPSYGHTRIRNSMVHSALRALGTKMCSDTTNQNKQQARNLLSILQVYRAVVTKDRGHNKFQINNFLQFKIVKN